MAATPQPRPNQVASNDKEATGRSSQWMELRDLLKRMLESVVPAGVWRWLSRQVHWRWFRGNYATWAEAKSAAGGYDDPAILSRVVTATRAVRAGEAAWERDGTLFKEPVANAPLLAVLRQIAEEEGGLEIVDFGGSLGSCWWQHRAWLGDLKRVRWHVVEQLGYVAAGRAEFTNDVLEFHSTLDEAGMAPVVLLSGVLQFLEYPHALLGEVVRRGFRHVVIGRTGFTIGGRERIVVQHTPPELGGGSYPSWLFERERLLAPLAGKYTLMTEWPSEFDQLDYRVDIRGLYFRRREQ